MIPSEFLTYVEKSVRGELNSAEGSELRDRLEATARNERAILEEDLLLEGVPLEVLCPEYDKMIHSECLNLELRAECPAKHPMLQLLKDHQAILVTLEKIETLAEQIGALAPEECHAPMKALRRLVRSHLIHEKSHHEKEHNYMYGRFRSENFQSLCAHLEVDHEVFAHRFERLLQLLVLARGKPEGLHNDRIIALCRILLVRVRTHLQYEEFKVYPLMFEKMMGERRRLESLRKGIRSIV